MTVRRDEPYGPVNGVTHTLKEHGLPGEYLNVVLEVRNDMLADEATQFLLATTTANWLMRALANVETGACKT